MAKVWIVGLGPGDAQNRTKAATDALKNAQVIIGYSVYADLIRDEFPDKEYLTSPMTKEKDRCQWAIDIARQGKDVAVICSGDSGVYGMAGLVYQLRADSDNPQIEVVAGLTAAVSGAALLGAPLTHDFAVISLSDRLTKWKLIEKRLENAALADFTIVLYNPASKGRPEHLKNACKILMKHIPPERICGVTRLIGREGEMSTILSLESLADYPADMFTTVFIGNSTTMKISDKMVTPRGYKDV